MNTFSHSYKGLSVPIAPHRTAMMNRKGKPSLGKLANPKPEPPPSVPANLEQHTTITIDNEQFEIQADDLEVICELGRFCRIVFARNM